MSVIGCIATSDAGSYLKPSSFRISETSRMPVVSPRRFSSSTSTVSSSSAGLTGSYRSTLNSSSSLDRPFYSSATNSYITPRSSLYSSSLEKRLSENKRSFARHSSITEDGGLPSSRLIRSDRSESRETSVRRDNSLSRTNDSIVSVPYSSRGDRSRDISVTGRRISSVSITTSVDDIRKKYSPTNYVPNVRKTDSKFDISRSKSISNDIGRPPIESKSQVEARPSINRKNKVTNSTELFVNGLSVSTNANSTRKVDGSSIEKIPKTSIIDNCVIKKSSPANESDSNWSEIELDDDNGNITRSVSEIRKKFDIPARHDNAAPVFLKNNSNNLPHKHENSQSSNSKTNELSVSCQNLKLSNKDSNTQNNGNNVRWEFLSNNHETNDPVVVDNISGVSSCKEDVTGQVKDCKKYNSVSSTKQTSNHTSNFASYIPVNNFEIKPVGDTKVVPELDIPFDEPDTTISQQETRPDVAVPGQNNSENCIPVIGDLDMSRDYRKQSSSRGFVQHSTASRYNNISTVNDISTSPRLNRSSLSQSPSRGSSSSHNDLSNNLNNLGSLQNSSNSLDRERSREDKSYEKHLGINSIKNLGLNGLRNIGNTCFMNSVIQCLSNTRFLLEYLRQDSYLNDINTTTSSMKGALVKAFSTVIQELWSSDSDKIVNTTALKSQIQRFAPRFMGYAQQDAQEFLRYLLEGLHEDVNRVTVRPTPINTEIDDNLSDAQKAAESWSRYLRIDDSAIVDVFVGQLKSTLKCTVCGHCSVTFDPFWDLSLPLASASLTHCLEHFTREETLDGHEKPTCAKCQQRRKCTKSFSIQKFPKILVLHLKRFSPMERFRGKLSTLVDFPLHGLDLSAFAANRGTSNCVYNLYAISNHSGTTYSGHYTAYCKHPYSNDWHEYNDSRVSSIMAKNVVSSEAYVLFYELANQSSHL